MSYQLLFDEMLKVINNYSLGTLLIGFDASLVNILLNNHLAKIELCTDYSTSIAMATHAISAHVGMHLQIDAFITEEKDRKQLYDLFQEWRHRLLADIEAQQLLAQSEGERCI